MRAVNLIPPDERRGDSAPLRTGSMVYVLVAGLALLLLGIVAVALTSKQVSDRKSEKAGLEQELAQETARANSLAAFANFRAVQESRTATLTSLADSRFDWSRVLQELSLVLPGDITLGSMTGSVSPEAAAASSGSSSGSGGGSDLTSSISGPSLDIQGCAPGQTSVAEFVAALEDIDGVTRVGLDSSQIGADSADSGSGGADSGAGECTAGPTTAKFHIVVAFDAVPTPPTATTAPSVPSAVPTGGDQSQVADAETDNQQKIVSASVQAKSTKAKNVASDAIPGG